jgi:hypothetical protein
MFKLQEKPSALDRDSDPQHCSTDTKSAFARTVSHLKPSQSGLEILPHIVRERIQVVQSSSEIVQYLQHYEIG